MNNCQTIIDFFKTNYMDILFLSTILILVIINYIFIKYSTIHNDPFSQNTNPIR